MDDIHDYARFMFLGRGPSLEREIMAEVTEFLDKVPIVRQLVNMSAANLVRPIIAKSSMWIMRVHCPWHKEASTVKKATGALGGFGARGAASALDLYTVHANVFRKAHASVCPSFGLLTYNGLGSIKVCDDVVVCDFDCDAH